MNSTAFIKPLVWPNKVQDHQSSSTKRRLLLLDSQEKCCDMISEINIKAFIKTDNYMILQTRLKRVAQVNVCLKNE